jgi:hypothetical protein
VIFASPVVAEQLAPVRRPTPLSARAVPIISRSVVAAIINYVCLKKVESA